MTIDDLLITRMSTTIACVICTNRNKEFSNILRVYTITVKVNYSFAVILKRSDRFHLLFEYSYPNKNNEVELDVDFKMSTDDDILKFEKLFIKSRGLHTSTHKSQNFIALTNVRFHVTRLF